MTLPSPPEVIYQPQQIPVTASYVAKEGDASRFARAVTSASRKVRAIVYSVATIVMGAVVYLTLPAFPAVMLTVLYGLILALSFRSRVTKVDRTIERVYLALFARPGARMSTRFGTECVDFECETSCSTYRYDILNVRSVDSEVVVLTIGGAPNPFPRALFPDDALARIPSTSRKRPA